MGAETGPVPGGRGRVGDAFLALGGGIGCGVAAYAVLAGIAGGGEPSTAQLFGVVSVAQSAGMGVLAWVILRRRGVPDPIDAVGLRFERRDTVGLALGFALQLALVLVLAPIVWLLGIDEAPQEAVRRTQEAGDATTLVAAFVAIVVFAPVAEEVVFRGMLLPALRARMEAWPAILVSAGAFAAIHLLDPGAAVIVPALFVVGVVLGWLAHRRGDIGLAVTTHVGFNFAAYLALVLT